MTRLDQWPRVKLVLEGALGRDGAELQAYVDEACGADAALRTEVERFLTGRAGAEAFLETPALVLLADDPPPREDLSGRVVGSYRLVSRLGAGGMGEVYLAHDTRLDRQVALKLLPPELAADRDRLRRFHRERRAAASLNHPHIVAVYDAGELDGRPYLVTEFVEGDTLRRRLARGRMPWREAADVAVQIAGALAAAHARGLVHRDVKPDNVMVRPDGQVKLLDFGLAKLTAPRRSSGRGDATSHTQPGTVLGTPRYMSPEQARGEALDARSDVWSLGVLLYEMLAGRPPFDGASAPDVLAALLGADPPPLAPQAPRAPAAAAAIVMRALRKERLDRYADAGELLADLRCLPAGTAATDAEAIAAAAEDDPDAGASLSPAGERRRVTVVVSVLSVATPAANALAAAALDEAMGRVRAIAADTMGRHGGVVNESSGREIVSLFGVPVAHEDDDLRAVRAALELHRRTREIAGPDLELRLQSGLHAGPVVAYRARDGMRRYAVSGPPVLRAARLAAAAAPDALLVSPDCQRLVAPFVRTEPAAPVALEDDEQPVTPHRVVGESPLERRLEEPRGLTPFTGRAAEMGALLAEIEAARLGEGRVALVVGEAGSGKSRLLHELRAQATASGFRVLQGRCRSSGGVASYLPFAEALHAALGVSEPDAASAAAQAVASLRAIEPSLEPLAPLYLHLLAMPGDRYPVPRHLRGEHFQAAMLEALAALFTSYAQRAPAVLLLEDWHWADDASRGALRHLMEVVAAAPLAIVVTTRPEATPWPEAPALRLHLGPLDSRASTAIMRSVLGVEGLPEELTRRLHERTGGNPFFLEEMCHALRESGAVTSQGTAAVVDGSAEALQLPDSIQAVIRSRLDRLRPEGREAIRVASVVGREFTRRILSDAAGRADLAGALDELKQAGLVQQIRVLPDAAYRFKHVLTQQVAYESLLEPQRKALHRAVARAIKRTPAGPFDPPLELLAEHLSHAEAWEEAIGYGLQAAARAHESSRFADALATLDRVQSWLMRLPDEPARRDRLADLLLRQERLCETLGLRARQLQLIADLIALLAPHGASLRLAETYLRQGDVSTLLKRFDAADRALATSLRLSRACGHAALERNVLRSTGLLRWHQGRHADALAFTEHALAIDRERQDDLAVAGDLSNLGNILRSMGEHRRALAALGEALAMPVVAGDPIKRASILHIVASVHRALGDVDLALDYLQQADDSARTHLLPIQRSFHLTSIAHIHLQEGRLDDSLRLYQAAVDLSRRARHADGLAQSLRMLGEVLFAIGREREALPHLQEAAQLFARLEDRAAETLMRRHAASVLERGGQPEAIAAWDAVRALAQAAGDRRGELDALEGLARTARAQDPGAAIARFEEALALASSLGEHGRETALRNTLGILHWERGAYLEALAHYEAALGLVRRHGAGAHEGLILNSIGVTLSRLRRHDEARTALEEALGVNRTAGDRRLEAHSLAALGDVDGALGRPDAAIAWFDASLAIRREMADRRGEGWMLHRLAGARALAGDAAGSAVAAAAAARIAAECDDAALRRACGLANDSSSGTDQRREE